MTDGDRSRSGGDSPLVFQFGHEELVIRRRYEVLSIANDLLIGVWFAVGSGLFFSPALTTTGTWLFLLGSVHLLVRPMIRLVRNLHLQRVGTAPGGELMGSGRDF